MLPPSPLRFPRGPSISSPHTSHSACHLQLFLTRLGLCGSAISFTQAAIFERHALTNAHWTGAAIGAWVGYSASLTSLYYLTSWFLVNADAVSGSPYRQWANARPPTHRPTDPTDLQPQALFNLSLLTSDVYAVLFSLFALKRAVVGQGEYSSSPLALTYPHTHIHTTAIMTHPARSAASPTTHPPPPSTPELALFHLIRAHALGLVGIPPGSQRHHRG